jgi:hypothetical protein
MNKSTFRRTLDGLRNLDVDNLNLNQQVTIDYEFPSTQQVLVSDVTTTPGTTEYETLTPSMIGLENLTAGTNITYTSGDSTYNGETAQTINSTDTTYSAGDGLDLTGTTFSADLKSGSGLTITATEMDLANIPNSALANSTISGISLGSNLSNLTAGTDIQFVSGSGPAASYNGTEAITINSTASDTTYAGGNNISIDTTPNPDEIDLDPAITGMTGIAYTGSGTTLTGGGGAGDETVSTYLDLSSATNIFPNPYPHAVLPYLTFESYDPVTATSQTLTTSFVQLFSGGLSSAFVAAGANVEVELKVMNYGGSSNRWLYLGLLDGAGTTEWTASMATGGGYGTGSAITERLVHYRDETDGQYQTMSWVLTGLTGGNTYIVNPSARTNSTSNYIYAGGRYPSTAFPACVFKVSQI